MKGTQKELRMRESSYKEKKHEHFMEYTTNIRTHTRTFKKN